MVTIHNDEHHMSSIFHIWKSPILTVLTHEKSREIGTSEAILFGALDGLREDVRESFQSVHQRFARLKRSHATFSQWKPPGGRQSPVSCRFFSRKHRETIYWTLDTFRVWCWWNSSKLPWHGLDFPIEITWNHHFLHGRRLDDTIMDVPGLRHPGPQWLRTWRNFFKMNHHPTWPNGPNIWKIWDVPNHKPDLVYKLEVWSIVAGWWFLTILKHMKVNGKDDIPYMKWKIKKCLKPPTSDLTT